MENDPDEFESLEVPVGASGRLDQWLAGVRPELSRSRWQKLLRQGHVLLDGDAVDSRTQVRPGQTVSVFRNAFESATADRKPAVPGPEDLPLRILYEDDAFLAIDKEPGMVVHPGNGCDSGTVVNAALNHCGWLPDLGDPERPGIVHRIDRETSGLLLIAKSKETGTNLQRAFREREIEKTYLAVVQGCPDRDAGTIDRPIGRHRVVRTRMAEVEGGRNAVTHWEILRRSGENWSLLKVAIETGRTHQIRVHLSARGHPLLGDRLYGYRPNRSKGMAADVRRVLLHAWTLTLTHPLSGEQIFLEAPPPEDLARFTASD